MILSFPEHFYVNFFLFLRDLATDAFLPDSLIPSRAYQPQFSMVSTLVNTTTKKREEFLVVQRLRPNLIKLQKVIISTRDTQSYPESSSFSSQVQSFSEYYLQNSVVIRLHSFSDYLRNLHNGCKETICKTHLK